MFIITHKVRKTVLYTRTHHNVIITLKPYFYERFVILFMKRLLSLVFIFVSAASVSRDRPKLVVGIVVDQMRQDYLYRFNNKFAEGGFKRLMNEGYQFKNAHYNYVPTHTGPGHASIYTGSTPSYHGIIGNIWYNKTNDRSIYCVADASVNAVGGSEQRGKMSPGNLKASTITDELLLTTNFRSKVIGVSIKDRGSILPAGHHPTGAYWFDAKTGNFMTSDYYMDTLPAWVKSFNKQKKVNEYLRNDWETLKPIDSYKESTKDNVTYEKTFKGQEAPAFPYKLSELVKENGVGIISTTPYGNSLVMDMAISSIEGEDLGNDDITDFLAVSFSSTDYVGHVFGPNSIELEDTYLRLDMEIKRLLDFLDQRLGDDYLVFLTADHGAIEVPSFLQDMKMVGGYVDRIELTTYLSDKLNERFGKEKWIKDVSSNQIFLDHDLIKEKGYDPYKFKRALRDIVISFDGVANAYTADELLLRNATDPVKKLFENGYHQKMSGDIAVGFIPGYLIGSGYGKAGTSHGSGYTYDTHIPILFFGKGIKPGKSVEKVAITDIAPTLSMLLDISLPDVCTGQPLMAIFE